MRIASYFFLIIIVLFGMTFAALNSESVTINFYLKQMSMPLSLLLVVVFALGCLLGMIVGLWLLFKSKLNNYRLKSKLQAAEKELDHLRTLPLREKA